MVTIRRALAVVLFTLHLGPAAVLAAEPPDAAPDADAALPAVHETVVVTARHREEALQEVPIAVTVVGDEELEERNVVEIQELTQATPNLKYDGVNSAATMSRIYIRGAGQDDTVNTTDPGVGVYLDGIYMARAHGGVFAILDLERVEVLRGPQGTLYGRNTVGGAINVVSARPRAGFGGNAALRAGSEELLEGRFTLNGALSERLFGRLSVLYLEESGYTENDFTGETRGDKEIASSRAALLYDNDGFSLDLAADVYRDDRVPVLANCALLQETGLQGLANLLFGFADACRATELDGDVYRGSDDYAEYEDVENDGLRLHLSWTLGNAVVRSITGYRQSSTYNTSDLDATPTRILFALGGSDHDQLSEELQLVGSSGDTDYTLGLYHFEEHSEQHDELFLLPDFPPLAGANTNTDRTVDNDNQAVYGQVTWRAGDKLSVTAGGRYTSETKKIEYDNVVRSSGVPLARVRQEDDFDAFTGLLSASYRLGEHTHGYASLSRGYKSGGFNGRTSGSFDEIETFEPEVLHAFELGLKWTSADGRAAFNGAAFVYDYTDMQLLIFQTNAAGGLSSAMKNAGEATVQGLEAELRKRLGEHFELRLAVGLNDAGYDAFLADITGDGVVTDNSTLDFKHTPEYNYNVGLRYARPTSNGSLLTLFGSLSGQAEAWASTANVPGSLMNARTLLDLRAAYDFGDGRYQLAAWGKNVTGEEYLNAVLQFYDAFGYALQYYGPPESFGVDLRIRF